MNVYMFNAALLCDECASELRAELGWENIADNGDSDTYPQGPYADGGGEADSPQHCDCCQLFLDNTLTREGEAYIQEAANCGKIPAEWYTAYNYCLGGRS